MRQQPPLWSRRKVVQAPGMSGVVAATMRGDGQSRTSLGPDPFYRLQVFRVGHYGGARARLVAASPWLAGTTQRPPSVAPVTGMVSCAWAASWRLHTDSTWVSGYYLALVTNAAGYCHWVPGWTAGLHAGRVQDPRVEQATRNLLDRVPARPARHRNG